ncbi:MAG TPA: LuxR C-terminal-related transcriptional regulator, partial [Trichococcus sp.]|nr:LuxR C-terminal-related transcriptional regulator [Trichococcus sp.]
MSKSPVKLTEQQIAKIKSLHAEGKTVYQISKQLHIAANTVKYHVERVLLAQLKSPHKLETYLEEATTSDGECSKDELYLGIIEELKTKNKKLLEILALH